VSERGGALLLMVVALAAVAAALLWRMEGAAGREAWARRAEEVALLVEVREALIGYALRDATRPGELPCPDYNRDGVIRIVGGARDYDGSRCRTEVAGVVNPGWLPWRTLGLPPARDGFGEGLWYVVADDFHANAATPLNSDTPAPLALDGEGGLAALVIAPGAPLEGQTPRPAAPFDALLQRGRFLEGENGDGDPLFAAAAGNDLLLPLERWRLMAAVERRVVAAAATLLADYRDACGGYPFAAPLGAAAVSVDGLREGVLPLDGAAPVPWGGACGGETAPRPPAWMAAWGALIHYAFAPLPCVAGGTCLRLVGEGGGRDDVEALVIVAGTDLTGRRPSAAIGDYLEGGNASPGDGLFEWRRADALFNDRVRVVAP